MDKRERAHADAVPILAAMKAIPLNRRLDALAVALAVYCETSGTLAVSGSPAETGEDDTA